MYHERALYLYHVNVERDPVRFLARSKPSGERAFKAFCVPHRGDLKLETENCHVLFP